MSYFKGPDIQQIHPDFRPKDSILKLLLERLIGNGDMLAVVEGQTGKSATFKDILQQSTAIAAGLQSAGVTAGDYVVICGDKSILAYCLIVGVMFTGATTVLFPVPHADILHKLTKGFPIKALFCDSSILSNFRKSLNYLSDQPSIIATMDPHDELLSALMSHSSKGFTVYEVRDVHKHIPMILFTSGTTGDPKGIQIRDIYLQHCGFNIPFRHNSLLVSSPLYWHSGGLGMFILASFNKFRLVLSNSRNAKENLTLLEKYKVEGCFAGTGSLSRFYKDSTFKHFDLSTVKQVFVGGEYILGSVVEAYQAKVHGGKLKVSVLYGNTEGGMLSTVKQGHQQDPLRPGTCGQVEPGVEIKILDEDGNLAPVGSMGELWTKSFVQFPGYWGRPDINISLFDKDGFFPTGDSGFIDKNGNLFVQGRVGDLINFKGTKIPPADVEDIMMSHEAVLDVAVVGKPHPTDVQHLTAFVVRVPGQHVTEQQLQDYVNDKVTENMQLRGGIYFLDDLPRTIIGKVQRKLLREMASVEYSSKNASY